MEPLTFIQKLIVWTPPVVVAVTLHEVPHGWMARARRLASEGRGENIATSLMTL
ncbi:MAG: hypothetical protein ACHBNF_17260 [Chromatiales bacterium]